MVALLRKYRDVDFQSATRGPRSTVGVWKAVDVRMSPKTAGSEIGLPADRDTIDA